MMPCKALLTTPRVPQLAVRGGENSPPVEGIGNFAGGRDFFTGWCEKLMRKGSDHLNLFRR